MSIEYTKKMYDHFLFFLVIILVYGLSFIILLLAPVLFPIIYSTKIGTFLGMNNLSLMLFPIYLNLLMILLTDIITRSFPTLRINNFPHLLLLLITTYILSVNLSVFYYSKSWVLNWGVQEFIDLGIGYLLIINFVLYAITILVISKMLYSDNSSEITNLHIIVRKTVNEIVILIFLAFVTIQIIFGTVYSGFDILDITPTLRLLVIYLFALASQPEK